MILQDIKKLYNFTSNCNTILKIRYKSDVVCASPYNIRKRNYNFPTSFIELSIIIDRKIIYSCYKDLTDEIQKGFNKYAKQ